MKKTIIIVLLVVNGLLTRAQNNAIFNGGTSDGWDKKAFLQTANNIYSGGSGDGWNYNAFAQTTANIYRGGNGDGWSFANFQQSVVNIYSGGDGDGWSYSNFLQAGNAIFMGGEGDGWNYNNFQQVGNGIFTGGFGDGWSSIYRPLGPLPVVFTSFIATKQFETALLTWQTAREENATLFDVERSTDAIHFIKIGTVAATGSTSGGAYYNFVDKQPARGYNYYRLKQVDRNGSFVYTPTRLLLFNGSSMQAIKAYPVPATTLLTVEIPASLRNEDVVFNLSNSIGVMVQQVKLSRNRADDTRILNLALLPAGIYTLQVSSQSFNGAQSIIKQ